ncbi:hypothetical protein COCSADRAFT_40007 [Bipolaris sorokiniana ND90Pr]|uniref:Uncharacterized protein n=1 Tax=Cochliobolus sativus (strain ND90Pr / ATCC 201652) TaxID=665912 RepID=M2SCZ7_COCSN|nr:uncharacterized protein COCSADRAFT_40007 [Bipolaris sorokiniana ND90Pr]EMD60365.1 hypothetical protein COCSADRAFT_40007 [Bipolaris sorokiniana ND90Pr]
MDTTHSLEWDLPGRDTYKFAVSQNEVSYLTRNTLLAIALQILHQYSTVLTSHIMAANSTIRYLPKHSDTTSTPQRQSMSLQSNSTTFLEGTTVPSISDESEFTLHTDYLVDHHLSSHSISAPSSPVLSCSLPHYTSAPIYGAPIVWFCSACRDGPKGDWQNVCTACNHQRCNACTVEKT